ncbi:hypothetical protein DFH27DRAFT_526009 [Peziza echinospora]|nr:hypothetical protein DFH27DRAFT_526009 [Peziza echinospora]
MEVHIQPSPPAAPALARPCTPPSPQARPATPLHTSSETTQEREDDEGPVTASDVLNSATEYAKSGSGTAVVVPLLDAPRLHVNDEIVLRLANPGRLFDHISANIVSSNRLVGYLDPFVGHSPERYLKWVGYIVLAQVTKVEMRDTGATFAIKYVVEWSAMDFDLWIEMVEDVVVPLFPGLVHVSGTICPCWAASTCPCRLILPPFVSLTFFPTMTDYDRPPQVRPGSHECVHTDTALESHTLEIHVPKLISPRRLTAILTRSARQLNRERKRQAKKLGIPLEEVVLEDTAPVRPPRGANSTMNNENKEKLNKLVRYHRLHYLRYFSVTNAEYHDMIIKFFGPLDVEESLFKDVRIKLMNYTRAWQNRLINNIESFWGELETSNPSVEEITEEAQCARYLNRIFQIQQWYKLLDFIDGVVDYQQIKEDSPVYQFCLNTFIWFCVYVRRAQKNPGTEGKTRGLPNGLFNRIKLFARHEQWTLKIEDFPIIPGKPESARIPRKPAPTQITEAHPGFQIFNKL